MHFWAAPDFLGCNFSWQLGNMEVFGKLERGKLGNLGSGTFRNLRAWKPRNLGLWELGTLNLTLEPYRGT